MDLSAPLSALVLTSKVVVSDGGGVGAALPRPHKLLLETPGAASWEGSV